MGYLLLLILVIVERIKIIVIIVGIVLIDLQVGVLLRSRLLLRGVVLVGFFLESIDLIWRVCHSTVASLVFMHR